MRALVKHFLGVRGIDKTIGTDHHVHRAYNLLCSLIIENAYLPMQHVLERSIYADRSEVPAAAAF